MVIKTRRKTHPKTTSRLKKKMRIRKKIFGTPERPRLCIYRSLRHITAQAIDDTTGTTLVFSTTQKLKLKSNKDSAATLAKDFAKSALSKKLDKFVFDRNGYLYHGRVKAFADAAREAGLNF